MKVKRYYSMRRPPVDPLKVIGGILMTLAFLGLGVLIASLIFGFGKEKTPDNASSTISSNFILNTSSAETSSENKEEITVVRDGAIRAAFLPLDVLNDNARLTQFISDAKETQITDVIITVKDETGIIYFDSDYEKAQYIKNESENLPDLENVVKTLHENSLNAVAQFHCFMDRTGTRIKNAGVLYLENHNVVWLDDDKANGGKSWLNPYSTEAKDYLEYLMNEVVELGFDVVMLDSVRFPDGYQIYAYYGENLSSREDCLRSFVNETKRNLAEKDTEMWLYASAVSYVDPNSEKFTKNVFTLGADTVVFNACPKNFPVRLAFDMTVIDNPIQNPKQTVQALIKLAQQKSVSTNVRLVPVLQAYTDLTIPKEYNLEYTKETLNEQFLALEETDLTDYAVFSLDGNLDLLK